MLGVADVVLVIGAIMFMSADSQFFFLRESVTLIIRKCYHIFHCFVGLFVQ